ncbi:hypothetical protein Pst134EA_009070 [Puccinia striiformis f. sp. tritici]|uniref:Dolichyl-phosphate-mannose--protein mannosyltransferase n=1 Tax=Puccinia striiformis f. sp. tritici PST-78 TaxID=1165861 RepID=A0A0L0VEZ8_9BASI|nr:hypothetical protein Pst134EA_009070 [Puccinia striiformis f. sp. tritici]KAH9468532.1 hypothetical protein Pst134EA_009070 [Puccinia striiformis f. sp. tritici]KAI9622109.1 hypothetical protein KEM48_007420 [Puccinia striiformis f. sp. tritici PST-130]KNE97776.1 hypothetical protein PSTG_08993 [Puccinia striiformis f. sp. tritici PST-78]
MNTEALRARKATTAIYEQQQQEDGNINYEDREQIHQKYRSQINSNNTFFGRLGGGLERLHTLEPIFITLITIVAGIIRCWKISRPASIVFDEVHFGRFASKYIKSEFFMDVHPPLVKLLYALIGYMYGYDGNFEFKEIGSEYSDRIPYLQMRLLPGLLGVLIVPISYLTLRMLNLRPLSSSLGSILIIFENGLTTQSRLILLDSPLLFFTSLTIFFHVGFCQEDTKNNRDKVLERNWWFWLMSTGLCLGLILSSKWIGLFTIAWIGLVTIQQLWELLADQRVSIKLLIQSFIARLICLGVIPLSIYLIIFRIHLAILSNSGDGDPFMSSEFQQTLNGRGMEDTYLEVLIGSNVTIKHTSTLGGYLHSHALHYPTGSHQQQITLYPHKDQNNLWTVLGRLADDVDIINRKPLDFYYNNKVNVNGSTFIRLNHPLTDKRLHTHDIRAPVSEVDYQSEVSGYGFLNYPGDANDEWIVEIVSKESDTKHDPISAKQLRTLRTKFRLRHSLQNCYLFTHKVKLPDWGFGQQEVTCNRNPTLASSLWYIESNYHPLLEKEKKPLMVNYLKPSFWNKFSEIQSVMWQTNKALVQHHAYGSRPSSWPILKRGMNFWAKDQRQIYLLGNPFIWWLSTISLGFYLVIKSLLILRIKRGYHRESRNQNVIKYDGISGYLVVGWATHYLPFYLMSRQLFIHHYFPSLYYSILLLSTIFDFTTSKLTLKTRLKAFTMIIVMAIWCWSIYAPLTYASTWTRSQCERARWRRTWDFSCHDFPEHMEDYEDALMDDFMDEENGMTNSSRSNRQGSDSKLAVHNRFKLLEPIMNVFQLPSSPNSPEASPDAFSLSSPLPNPIPLPLSDSSAKDHTARKPTADKPKNLREVD